MKSSDFPMNPPMTSTENPIKFPAPLAKSLLMGLAVCQRILRRRGLGRCAKILSRLGAELAMTGDG